MKSKKPKSRPQAPKKPRKAKHRPVAPIFPQPLRKKFRRLREQGSEQKTNGIPTHIQLTQQLYGEDWPTEELRSQSEKTLTKIRQILTTTWQGMTTPLQQNISLQALSMLGGQAAAAAVSSAPLSDPRRVETETPGDVDKNLLAILTAIESGSYSRTDDWAKDQDILQKLKSFPTQLAIYIVYLQRLWLRPLRDWHYVPPQNVPLPDKVDEAMAQLSSLLDHLFVIYPVTPVYRIHWMLLAQKWMPDEGDFSTQAELYRWEEENPLLFSRNEIYRCLLFVLLGRGASICRIGEGLGRKIRRKLLKELDCLEPLWSPRFEEEKSQELSEKDAHFSRCLREARSNFNLEDCLWMAWLASKGAEFLLLHYFKDFLKNNCWNFPKLPLEEQLDSKEPNHTAFWLWVVKNLGGNDADVLPGVISWYMLRCTKRAKNGAPMPPPNFSIGSKTLLQVMDEHNNDYHDDRLRYAKNIADRKAAGDPISWGALGIDFDLHDKNGVFWQIGERTTSEELMEEGKAMRHCVWGFDKYCMNGVFRIASLLRDGKRALTIEFREKPFRVTQVKGACNRQPTQAEMLVLSTWICLFQHKF